MNTAGDIRIIPLGGLGEIGMNGLLVEHAGRLLAVDCGVMFPAEPRLGVDLIHSSFQWPASRAADVDALLITHGHEDHMGAVPFFLDEIDAPVFAGDIPSDLIRRRLSEYRPDRQPVIHGLQDGVPFRAGGFRIEPVAMPHSAPDNFGFLIEAGGRRIFITGDFKLDACRPGAAEGMQQRLSALRPIDLLMTDSTGVFEEAPAGDEASVEASLGHICTQAPGRVFVTLFASNLRRMEGLARIARRTGRRIVLSGRSVHTHFSLLRDKRCGDAFDDLLVGEDRIDDIPDDGLLVILSGTQAEGRSAFGRLAAGTHGKFGVRRGDTVVLSSRFIPGNELTIRQAVNRLLSDGAAVFHPDNRPGVHVSGHGSRGEIRAVMESLAPAAVLPVHGTVEHLQAVAALAAELEIPSVVARDGQVVVLCDGGPVLSDDVIDCGAVYRDQSLQVLDGTVRRERMRLSCRGFVHVTALLTRPGDPLADVTSGGVFCEESRVAEEQALRHRVMELLATNGEEPGKILEERLILEVKRMLRQDVERRPLVTVRLMGNEAD